MVTSALRYPLLLTLLALALAPAQADESVDRRIPELEGRIAALENRVAHPPTTIVSRGSDGAALFLYGCFYALMVRLDSELSVS